MPVSTPAPSLTVYGGDADHFQHVLDHLFIPAAEKAGFTALSPVTGGGDIIHAEIIRKLETADLVLCDMSALNANVFFELGIRTALDRPTLLVRDNVTKHVPFDTIMINHVEYDASLTPWTVAIEVDKLSRHIVTYFDSNDKRNTLWKYFGLTKRAEAVGPASIEEKLNAILESLPQLAQRSPMESMEHINSPVDTSTESIIADRFTAAVKKSRDVVNSIKISPGKVLVNMFGDSMPHEMIMFHLKNAHLLGISLQVIRGGSVGGGETLKWPAEPTHEGD